MIKLHPDTSGAIAHLINSIEVVADEKNSLLIQANYEWDQMNVDQRNKNNLRREELKMEYNKLLIKLYDNFGIELPCYRFIDRVDSVMKLEKAF
tara:strand:+ start:199 stop:480 length:282 start_codon:yes stop_codon:yes gene_type:complete